MWGAYMSDDVITIILNDLKEIKNELKKITEMKIQLATIEAKDFPTEIKEIKERVDILEKDKTGFNSIKGFIAWLIATLFSILSILKDHIHF